MADANMGTDGVQLIVHSIDGVRPERAGPARRSDGGGAPPGGDAAGAGGSPPPRRPARGGVGVAPG
ncbi:MAG: hypothetical protein LH480_10125, partial [Rubrivivax sp.]|nr:hypothetical protein [Rubrivivax sp.]